MDKTFDKRHYTIPWTQEETERFINARVNLENLFTGKFFVVKSSWEKVLSEAQLEVDDWRKDKKNWSNLMDKYKSLIEPSTGLGTEGVGPEATTWPYFEVLYSYCSERHNIKPPMVVDTGVDDVIIAQNTPSTSTSVNETGRPSDRKRKRCSCDNDEVEKQFKLLEKATKYYIKYMSTLVELSESESEL